MAPRRRCSRSIITPERPNFEQVPIFLSARWERGSVAHRDSSMWVGEWERGKVAKSGAICISAAPCDNESYLASVSLCRVPTRRGQFSFWRDLSGWNIERNLAAHYSSGFITPPPARRLNLHRCSKDRRKRPDEKLARADGRSFRRSLARLVSDPRSAAPRPTTDRPWLPCAAVASAPVVPSGWKRNVTTCISHLKSPRDAREAKDVLCVHVFMPNLNCMQGKHGRGTVRVSEIER